MTQSLFDILSPSHSQTENKTYGVVVGIVTNNVDPDKMGRVKVRFPWLSQNNESYWARTATPMAGNNRGFYFLPEVNDEVLVAFEQGDIRFPYILGALWNGKDMPPEKNSDEKNNNRTIKSRSGHIIRLNDEKGKEKIEIIDKSQKNSIIFSTKENTITITANADITVTSKGGKLKLSGNGVEIKSQADVKIEANTTLDVKSKATMNIKGALVNIN